MSDQQLNDLFSACRLGDADRLSTLIDQGADPSSQGLGNATLLMTAAYNNDTATTAVLLSRGARAMDVDLNRQTALHHFAFNMESDPDLALIDLLLESGLPIDAADARGDTALHCAITAAAQYQERQSDRRPCFNLAPLIERLVERGADVHWEGRGLRTAIQEIMHKKSSMMPESIPQIMAVMEKALLRQSTPCPYAGKSRARL